jgi:hypothetical protein
MTPRRSIQETTARWSRVHMYIVASSAFKSAQSVGGVVIQRMCEQELAEDGAVRNIVSYMVSRYIPEYRPTTSV